MTLEQKFNLNSNQLEIKNAANSAVGLKYQEGHPLNGTGKQFETSSKGVRWSGVTIEINDRQLLMVLSQQHRLVALY